MCSEATTVSRVLRRLLRAGSVAETEECGKHKKRDRQEGAEIKQEGTG